MCCKLLQKICKKYLTQGCRQRGASGVRSSHLKYVSSHFMFGTLVAAYIQYCIFQCAPSPFVIFGPLAVNSW